mgnify:CR=1 FL=1
MEWVIKDIGNDTYLRFESDGELIVYGNRDEAEADLYGNEVVVIYDKTYNYEEK